MLSTLALTLAPILGQTGSGVDVEPSMLLSVVKPALLLPPFIAYVWITGSKFDKDSRYFQIDPARWAVIFALAPIPALAAALLIPIFWIGWPVAMIILGATLAAYVLVRNGRVPESNRWNLGALKIGESVQARKEAAALKSARLRFLEPSKRERPVPVKDDPLHAVHMAVEMLLDPALEGRATRLELAPTPQGFIPVQVVDGMKFRREPMPPDVATAVIDYVKGVAGLDVAERRKKQSGDFWIVSGDTLVKTSLTASGGSAGQAIRIDFDREKQLSKPADQIGMFESQLKLLAPVLEPGERRGVILVATAPGQGLTTLLYSLVSRHDAFTCNVKSIEKQLELRVDGVDQQLWNPANPTVDFANHLQSMVRRGPDIILVSDLLEPRVGPVVAGAAGDTLFYAGISVNVPAGQEVGAALREWFRAVGDIELGAKPLRGIVTQRLIRKVCENCRQPHPRAAEIAKRIGAPAGAALNLVAASGKVQMKNRVEACPICKGSGFLGQLGVHEVLTFDSETRGLLAANDANGAYTTARRKLRSPTLLEAGLQRVRDGTTSIEEYQRVFAPPKAPAAAGVPVAAGAGGGAAPAAGGAAPAAGGAAPAGGRTPGKS